VEFKGLFLMAVRGIESLNDLDKRAHDIRKVHDSSQHTENHKDLLR
jgi:hypothetical protein